MSQLVVLYLVFIDRENTFNQDRDKTVHTINEGLSVIAFIT